MEQFVITGPSRSGKTTFISKCFDLSSQSIKISALTAAKNLNNIIIDEFNYGVSSLQTKKLIASVLNTVNTLNFKYLTGQKGTPFIKTIV